MLSALKYASPPIACALVLAACGSSPATGGGPDGSAGGDASQTADGGTTGESGVDGSTASCITARETGTHTYACPGVSVTVSAPAACATTACGVILDIHGLYMNADLEDAMTDLRAKGGAAGYVVVQPTAPADRSPYGPMWEDSDDAAVYDALMQVVKVWGADTARVHVTGLSQGGYMTWRLVCEHADLFASAAPALAGSDKCPNGNFNGSCPFTAQGEPSRELPLLYLAAQKDALVPYACSTAERDAVVAAWALSSKQTIAGDGHYTHDRYTAGDGTTLDFFTEDYTTDPQGALAANAGHCVPGATPATSTVWDQLACKPPTAFVWGQEVLDFFTAHPKK